MVKLILKPILLVAVLAFMTTACQKKSSPSSARSKDSAGARGNGTGGDGSGYAGTGAEKDKNEGGGQRTDEGSRYAGTGGNKRTGGPAIEDVALDPSRIDVEAVSTGASNANSASYGDYLWNPPGLPYPVAEKPIFTGGESDREYKVTDANDDSLMSYLVTLANEEREKDEEFGKNSLVLARAISNIYTRIDRSNSNFDVEIGVKSGQREYIIPFRGRLTANRRVHLDNIREKTTYEEIDRQRLKGNYKERKFRLTLACVDKTTGCTSVIMRLDQLQLKEGLVRSKDTQETDWVLCRSVYALARVGNVHLQIDENDYVNYESYARINNNQYEFVRMLANSAHYVRYKTKSLQKLDRKHANRPRLHNATIDAFAVAYGYGGFRINLLSAAPMNREGLLVSGTTSFAGPLFWASSRIANDNDMYPFGDYRMQGTPEYAAMIDSVKLVENDGRGQMAMVMNYKGMPESSTQVNFTTLFDETIDPFKQRGLKDEQPVVIKEGQPQEMAPMPPRELKTN